VEDVINPSDALIKKINHAFCRRQKIRCGNIRGKTSSMMPRLHRQQTIHNTFDRWIEDVYCGNHQKLSKTANFLNPMGNILLPTILSERK